MTGSLLGKEKSLAPAAFAGDDIQGDVNCRAVKLARSILVAAALAGAPQVPARSDVFVAPIDGLALVRTLNAELLASRSATQTLERWCGDQHLAAEPRIVARLVTGADKSPSPEQRQHLQVGPGDPVKFRHVRLQCGTRVLSEADNWYVPGRLTPEMNRTLENSDTPFGTVVRALEPSRQTLEATTFWAGEQPVPQALFAHRAVLRTRDGVPFSEVYEVYQRQLLP
jgi:chorismate-pyruvate lyase